MQEEEMVYEEIQPIEGIKAFLDNDPIYVRQRQDAAIRNAVETSSAEYRFAKPRCILG